MISINIMSYVIKYDKIRHLTPSELQINSCSANVTLFSLQVLIIVRKSTRPIASSETGVEESPVLVLISMQTSPNVTPKWRHS